MSLLHIQKRWLQKNLKRKLPKCTAYVEMSPPTEEAAVIGINGSPCLEPVKLWMELMIEREKKLKLGFWLDINCPQLLITSHLEDDKPSWPEIKCSVSVRSLEMSMESFLCLTHSVPIKKNKKTTQDAFLLTEHGTQSGQRQNQHTQRDVKPHASRATSESTALQTWRIQFLHIIFNLSSSVTLKSASLLFPSTPPEDGFKACCDLELLDDSADNSSVSDV